MGRPYDPLSLHVSLDTREPHFDRLQLEKRINSDSPTDGTKRSIINVLKVALRMISEDLKKWSKDCLRPADDQLQLFDYPSLVSTSPVMPASSLLESSVRAPNHQMNYI